MNVRSHRVVPGRLCAVAGLLDACVGAGAQPSAATYANRPSVRDHCYVVVTA